jgi:hypothetical protein
MLYGAVVSGAALGALSAHADDATRVAIATTVVLVVYWLAHVYIHALTQQLRDQDTRHLWHRVATSTTDEINVLIGGVPALVVYVGVVALGGEQVVAGYVALSALIVLLGTVSFVGARQVGLPVSAACIEAAGAASLGVLIMVMKALLH